MTTPAQHLQHAAAMAAANTGMFGMALPSSSSGSVPSAAATASTSAAHGNSSTGDGGGQSAPPPAVPLSGPSTSTSHPVGAAPSPQSGAGQRRTPLKAQAPNKASASNNNKDKGDKKTRSRLACESSRLDRGPHA
ncbi:BQ5605_C027g10319 [Microbotryum silenes-dioicae]|uniref:BQ5605_C027g10319 protein n=1 Tax=Microbotryum silenes-dioicae TaxID=796604 RepID=A0A2X0PGK9_9BASI|nr:BQ5605_C027g10319 [Microbotryum silenes-dioicae]